MIERIGNLWDSKWPVGGRIITTNGIVKSNGACVMGRGCAKEARDMFPGIDKALGSCILAGGNHVHDLGTACRDSSEKGNRWSLISFPVKHHWKDVADLALIKRSAEELVALKNDIYGENIYFILPRPGCGNGQRDWETEVKPLLEPIFDDMFVVVSF
jgi:hypothetical protein